MSMFRTHWGERRLCRLVPVSAQCHFCHCSFWKPRRRRTISCYSTGKGPSRLENICLRHGNDWHVKGFLRGIWVCIEGGNPFSREPATWPEFGMWILPISERTATCSPTDGKLLSLLSVLSLFVEFSIFRMLWKSFPSSFGLILQHFLLQISQWRLFLTGLTSLIPRYINTVLFSSFSGVSDSFTARKEEFLLERLRYGIIYRDRMCIWSISLSTVALLLLRQVLSTFNWIVRSILAMYDYLAPQGNTYRPQFQANKMLFVRTKGTIELAVKWSVSLLYIIKKMLGSSSVLWKARAWLRQRPN